MKLYLIDNKTAPKSQRFRWQLVGENGKIVAASSEGFATRAGCTENVRDTWAGLDINVFWTRDPMEVNFARRRAARKVSP